MKKLATLLLVLVLTLTSTALAFTPSKTTGDNTKITIIGTNIPEGATIKVQTDEKALAIVEAELKKLSAAQDVATYFAQKDEIIAILGEGNYSVNEFLPFAVAGFDGLTGDVELAMSFSTLYKEGEVVAVMIGLVDEAGAIVWKTFEGIGQADGSVQVVLDAETILGLQGGTALLAIVSIEAA